VSSEAGRSAAPYAAAAGLLLWARRAADIGRLLHGAGRPAATAPQQHGAQQHMRAVPRFPPP